MILVLVLAIFLALLGIGISAPTIKTWPLADVAEAVKDPDNAPRELESLVEQIKQNMYPSFFKNLLVKSPTGKDKWRMEQIQKAIFELDQLDPEHPNKFPEFRKALQYAYEHGERNKKTSVYVGSPSTQIQTWTLAELNKYLGKSKTRHRPNAQQVREHRDLLEDAINRGKNWITIGMLTIPDYYYDAVPAYELYG